MGNVSGKGVNEFRGDQGEATTISPPKAAKPSLKEVFSVLVSAFSQKCKINREISLKALVSGREELLTVGLGNHAELGYVEK